MEIEAAKKAKADYDRSYYQARKEAKLASIKIARKLSLAKPVVTRSRVLELVEYEPSSGQFYRVVVINGLPTRGRKTGCKNPQGYVQLVLDNRNYQAHRVAWLCVHMDWPAGEIDHADGDKSNNRISNLRDVDRRTNSQNIKGPHRNNKLKLLGVSQFNGKFVAQIGTIEGKKHLGLFDEAQEAHNAYLSAKRQLHEGNTL